MFCLKDVKLQVGRRLQGQTVSKSKVVKVCRSPKCDGWDILQSEALARELLSLLVIMRFWENPALCGKDFRNFVRLASLLHHDDKFRLGIL